MHGLGVDKIPDINPDKHLSWEFWPEASTAWGVGCDVPKTIEVAQNGVADGSGVYVCGAAWSTVPGWVEGAFRSALSLTAFLGAGGDLWAAVDANDPPAIEAALDRQIEGLPSLPVLRAVHHAGLQAGDDIGGGAGEGLNGATPLIFACVRGHLEAAQILLESGADVNGSDFSGATPLHKCCASGNADLTELLLTFNADVAALDRDGFTPLELARDAGHSEVLAVASHRYLLRHGQRMDATPSCVVPPGWAPPSVVEAAFRKYDPKGTGTIPASALAALSADLGEPMAPAEVSEMRLALQAGEDSAGVVTFSDFAAFWNSD